jgi:hypothetical protein
VCASAGIALWLGCGTAEAPPSDYALRPASFETRHGLQIPPRVHDDGSPDACDLLGEASPRELLGAEVGPALRIYGMCRVAAQGPAEPERSAALEIRRDRAGVPHDLDAFWEREGGGVGMLGSRREEIRELDAPGDYALWFPIDGGLQLHAFWQDEYILVLTIRGVPAERALLWARELAQRSVVRASSLAVAR